MNPQLPLNCEQARIECSINHVSPESQEKIESFQLIAGDFQSFGGFTVQEKQEMKGSVVEVAESFQIFEVKAENQVKVDNFDAFTTVAENQEMTETALDFINFQVIHVKAESLDGFSVKEERVSGGNISEALLDVQEMSETVVGWMQQVSGDNGVECFRAESDKLSKSQEFVVDKLGLIVMAETPAESSIAFLETSHVNVGKSGIDAGNCRAEAMEDHAMVQCDGKVMTSVDVGEQTGVFETGNKGVERQGLMGTSKKRAGNRSRPEEEINRKNGVGYNRNVKGKVCWVKVNRDLTQKKENGSKRSYSRYEMVSLRFLNIEGQQRMWNEVCLRMGPAVTQEYDDMVDKKPRKQVCENFDHRQRFVNKKENGAILSMPKRKGNGSFHSMPRRKENVPILSVMATH